tara:strand:- start:534 stop:749 length:216 start_codon:yes stop_codon:yes gene_type:complete
LIKKKNIQQHDPCFSYFYDQSEDWTGQVCHVVVITGKLSCQLLLPWYMLLAAAQAWTNENFSKKTEMMIIN